MMGTSAVNVDDVDAQGVGVFGHDTCRELDAAHGCVTLKRTLDEYSNGLVTLFLSSDSVLLELLGPS